MVSEYLFEIKWQIIYVTVLYINEWLILESTFLKEKTYFMTKQILVIYFYLW